MLSDTLPFLHILKDHIVHLTEKSGDSVILHSSAHFSIYSMDEKKIALSGVCLSYFFITNFSLHLSTFLNFCSPACSAVVKIRMQFSSQMYILQVFCFSF